MSYSDTTKHGAAGNNTDARAAAAEAGTHVRKAASAATEAADLTYEELRAQVETLKEDLTGLMGAARSAGVETARKAYGSARRAGRKAVAVAEDGYELAGERLDDAFSGTEEFVRERPALSLGLAAGAGFLLAMFLSRR